MATWSTFRWKNQNWTWDTRSDELTSNSDLLQRSGLESFSPDRKWKAFTRNYNLYLQNLETGEEIQLSKSGRKGLEYASFYGWSDLIEGENGERPDRFTVTWSPDSKKIYTQIVDSETGRKDVYAGLFESPKNSVQNLLSYYRGSPGDSTVVKYIPVVFDLDNKSEKTFPELTSPHFIGINLNWSKDSQSLSGFFIHRGYKTYDLIELNSETGKIRTIYSESADTHIQRDNIFQQVGGQHVYSFLRKVRLESTLPDGLGHRQRNSSALTQGEFVVNRLSYLDEENRIAWLEISGKEAGRNPYFNHLYRLQLDSGELELITKEDALP
jgi:dipeptidyl-peptidase 4